MELENYLETSKIASVVQGAVQTCFKEQPADVNGFLAEYFTREKGLESGAELCFGAHSKGLSLLIKHTNHAALQVRILP